MSCAAGMHAEVERTLQIPPHMQKLMFKGLLKTDSDTLEKVCWCSRCCLLLWVMTCYLT